jgi:hypothetical protein
MCIYNYIFHLTQILALFTIFLVDHITFMNVCCTRLSFKDEIHKTALVKFETLLRTNYTLKKGDLTFYGMKH